MSSRSAKLQGAAAEPRRQRAPQQRTLDTRHKILEAAFREFAERGFEGASTRSIAAEAGVQHGLITYHFEGKDGLWREVLRHTQTEWRDLMRAGLRDSEGLEASVILRRILEAFIQYSARRPEFHAVMSHASSSRDERLDWLVTEFVKPHFDTLSDLIRKAQQEGRFVPGDPVKLQYLFIGAAVRVFMVSEEVGILTGQSPFTDAFIEEHTRLCVGLFFR